MHNIEKIHVGEDYTKYSYTDENGEEQEAEVTGIAQEIINTLGKALMKKSFLYDCQECEDTGYVKVGEHDDVQDKRCYGCNPKKVDNEPTQENE